MNLLITSIYYFFYFSNIPGGVQLVKYDLSRISTSRNIKLKKPLKFSFLVFSADFFEFYTQYLWLFEYVPNKCPNQFLYYIEFIFRRAYEKNLSLSFMFWFISRPQKSGCFFGKFTADLVLKEFLGKNNFLEVPVFGFSNSLPYVLEEWRELRALISWVLG